MGIDVSKVSEEGFEFDETALSEFCGRRKDVDDIVRLITKKGIKTLCVHGAKSIGKTRVINHVLMNEKLNCFQQICHIDCSSFEEDCVDNFFIQFLKEFYESVGLEKNLKPCGACELCAHKTGCTKLNRETLLKEIPLTLKHVQEATLICFDNADKLLNSSFRGKFLDFLQTVTEKRKNINIKILVASTVRFHMTTKATELRLVDKMAKEDLKTMMVGILNHNNDDIDDIDESDEVGKSGIKYLSALRTQDPWLEAVAILCDGIPKCAELLGKSLYIIVIVIELKHAKVGWVFDVIQNELCVCLFSNDFKYMYVNILSSVNITCVWLKDVVTTFVTKNKHSRSHQSYTKLLKIYVHIM